LLKPRKLDVGLLSSHHGAYSAVRIKFSWWLSKDDFAPAFAC